VDLLREPANLNPLTGMDYARGVVDLATVSRGNGQHRASGEMPVHIVEIMAAIAEAAGLRQAG
jgi:hypothetical protein